MQTNNTDPARWLGGLALAVLLVTSFLALYRAPVFLRACSNALETPFELDYGEGVALCHTREWLEGRSLYPPLDEPPWILNPYPPLFPVISGAAVRLTGAPLTACRLLSMVSTLACALLVAALVLVTAGRFHLPHEVGREARLRDGLAALTAACLFLTAWPVLSWGPLCRVDTLGLALSLGGMAVFLAGKGRGRHELAGLLLFLLAAYVKQSFLLGAAACLLALLLVDRGRAMRLTGLWAGGGLLAMAVLTVTTGGRFLTHIAAVSGNPYHGSRTWMELGRLSSTHGWLLILAAAGALVAAWRFVRTPAGQRPHQLLMVPLFLLLSAAFCLNVGYEGGNTNYFLEFLAAACLATGVLLARLCASAQGPSVKRAGRPVALCRMLVIAVTGFVGFQLITLDLGPMPAAWQSIQRPIVRTARRAVLDAVKASDGPVLSDDMTLLVLSGKPLVFQPHVFSQLAQTGRWDQGPLLRLLEGGAFDLLVLQFQIDGDGYEGDALGRERFSDEMLKRIAVHYEIVGRYGRYRLYRPLTQ